MNKGAHRVTPRRTRMLAVLVTALLAGHGAILYYVSSHVMLSAAVLSGAIILLVIKHLGLLGPLYALWWRRRPGHRR